MEITNVAAELIKDFIRLKGTITGQIIAATTSIGCPYTCTVNSRLRGTIMAVMATEPANNPATILNARGFAR